MSDIDTAAIRYEFCAEHVCPDENCENRVIGAMCDEIDRLRARLDRAANLCGRAGALCVREVSS